jgi:hypothetical protein
VIPGRILLVFAHAVASQPQGPQLHAVGARKDVPGGQGEERANAGTRGLVARVDDVGMPRELRAGRHTHGDVGPQEGRPDAQPEHGRLVAVVEQAIDRRPR